MNSEGLVCLKIFRIINIVALNSSKNISDSCTFVLVQKISEFGQIHQNSYALVKFIESKNVIASRT